MKILYIIIILAAYITLASDLAHAFWIWTPRTQKLINPKYAVKDTPEQQYDWAMSLYESRDYNRASEEFLRLIANYENSKLAPEAQFYAGKSYQKAGKYYPAFQNYQKVVDNYPYTKRVDEIIELEYELGEILYNKNTGTLMGIELMADTERAIEIFNKVIENAPYSQFADNAQFMIGLSYKKIQQYNEAIEAFQKLTQEYPTSDLVERAKYEAAQCMYFYSFKSDYDQEPTDEAIDEFKRYTMETRNKELKREAEQTITLLKEKKAQSIFKSAEFYEKVKKYQSAVVYYKEIIKDYPDTSYAPLAKIRIEYINIMLEKKGGKKNEKN